MGWLVKQWGVEKQGEEGTEPDTCQMVNWNFKTNLTFQGSLGSCPGEAIFGIVYPAETTVAHLKKPYIESHY